MNQKGFVNIIVIIGIVLLVGAAGYFVVNRQTVSPPTLDLACTEDLKLCPDGSYVGRTGANCEFAECPGVNPSPTPTPPPVGGSEEEEVSLQEGQREGPLLIEKIYPDRVTGLNFLEYPVAVVQGQPMTLHIGESASNGCTITLTLIRIEGNTATFIKKTDFNQPCPRCLAGNTLIDTPSGAVAVQQLKEGAEVWTVNRFGARVPAKILETVRTPVPSWHRVTHLILDDGRELFVSPGHPIGDGRTISDLSVGGFLDGGRVLTIESILYQKDYTYDILPSGETGFYWANGILLASTLH